MKYYTDILSQIHILISLGTIEFQQFIWLLQRDEYFIRIEISVCVFIVLINGITINHIV